MGRYRLTKRFPKRYCTLEYLRCFDYNEKGQGVVIFKNKPFYIDGLIIGESAQILIFYEYPENGQGKVARLQDVSSDRKLPFDHPKLALGIYHLAHLQDKAQDQFKQNLLEKVFEKQINPIIVGKRTHYRNKVVLSDGGFKPPGKRRKYSIIPTNEQFDLMKIDFTKFQNVTGDLIIRRLNTEIVGKPGTNLITTDNFLNKVFQVNLNAFYQVNGEMARLAYKQIIEKILPNSIVFDLFAGAATIGICVSDQVNHVYAVEINHASYQDAMINIELNHAKNVTAILADANQWMQQTLLKPDVIIIDPARNGLAPETCQIINNSNAKQIIYLSCNIFTQKRDLDFFTNYQIDLIQPYDFFPQTYHIENLIILKKQDY